MEIVLDYSKRFGQYCLKEMWWLLPSIYLIFMFLPLFLGWKIFFLSVVFWDFFNVQKNSNRRIEANFQLVRWPALSVFFWFVISGFLLLTGVTFFIGINKLFFLYNENRPSLIFNLALSGLICAFLLLVIILIEKGGVRIKYILLFLVFDLLCAMPLNFTFFYSKVSESSVNNLKRELLLGQTRFLENDLEKKVKTAGIGHLVNSGNYNEVNRIDQKITEGLIRYSMSNKDHNRISVLDSLVMDKTITQADKREYLLRYKSENSGGKYKKVKVNRPLMKDSILFLGNERDSLSKYLAVLKTINSIDRNDENSKIIAFDQSRILQIASRYNQGVADSVVKILLIKPPTELEAVSEMYSFIGELFLKPKIYSEGLTDSNGTVETSILLPPNNDQRLNSIQTSNLIKEGTGNTQVTNGLSGEYKMLLVRTSLTYSVIIDLLPLILGVVFAIAIKKNEMS